TNNAPHTLPNPTDRSPWSLHIQPTNKQRSPHSSQSHGPQSVVPSYPTYEPTNAPHTLPIPTDRSPWSLHIQPTNKQRSPHSSQSHGPQSVVASYPTYKATGIFTQTTVSSPYVPHTF